MGKPPLEIVAYSSWPIYPFRLKQNRSDPSLIPQSGLTVMRSSPTTFALMVTPQAGVSGSLTLDVRIAGASGDSMEIAFPVTVSTPAPPPVVPVPSGFGPRRDAFVTSFYHDGLARWPKSSGLYFWSRRLALGARPRAVGREIYTSPEHKLLVQQGLAPPIRFSHALLDAFHAARWAVVPKHPSGPLAQRLAIRTHVAKERR
jgi:hypothetical protein